MMNLLLPFLLCLAPAQEPTQPAPQATLQVYDVTDILHPNVTPTATVTVGGRKGSQVVTQEVPPAAPEAEAATAEQQQQRLLAATGHLCERIRALIDPPLASGESLQASGPGQVLLYAGPERQAWLRELLKRNRPQEQLLFVQSHWIEGPKGAFARMGIAPGGAVTVLGVKDGERFLALDKDSGDFSVRSAPRALVQPLVASSSIMVGRVLSYVKEWKLVTVQPGDVKIADPEIGTVDVGFSMQMQGVLLEGGKVALELDTTNTSVAEPIPTKSVTLDPAYKQELTIGVPVIDTKSIHAKCTLSSEGLIAFCSPVAGHDDRELLILVRAHAQSVAELKAGTTESTITGGKKKAAEPPK
jgi:hypothetical protein